MTRTAAFAAELVRASGRGLSGLAAARFFERSDGAAERFGDDGFESWRRAMGARLDALASALDADDPKIFADDVLWFRGMSTSRDVRETEIELALDCLGEIVGEQIPDPATETVAPYFDAARLALVAGAKQEKGLAPGSPAAELFDLALVGDLPGARHYLADAVQANRLTVENAILDVLLPAARESGRRWHLGELGVATEHIATSTLRGALYALAASLEPGEPNGKAAFIAAVPGDAHDTGLVAFALLLEHDGWRVVLSGADTPADEIDATAEAYGCDLIALSATLASQRTALLRYLEERVGGAPVLVGGSAVHGVDDAKAIGASGYAPDLAAGVTVARRLVGLDD